MTSSSKKRRRRSASPSTPAESVGERLPPRQRLSRRRRWGHLALCALGGFAQCLGYAGFSLWPFALVCWLPMFYVLDREAKAGTRRVLALGWLHGFVGYAGGYYWLAPMLQNFSGFGVAPATFFASFFWAYQGCQQMLVYWLFFRARRRGHSVTLAAVAALLPLELFFPTLFPTHLADGFHDVLPLLQIADLGGAILVSAVVMSVNGALYEALTAWRRKAPFPRAPVLASAIALVLSLAYGFWRIAEVDARAADARTLRVGTVQVGMGIFEKRDDPWEGHRRHLVQSRRLERRGDLDLLVWPESAFTFFLPEGQTDLREHVTRDLRTPILFGGLARRRVGGQERHYNTAYLAGADGSTLGTYDKTYLLAFGEYLPFGETFPVLYEWSPNSGRFTPGDHVRPLTLPTEDGEVRITTLVCYEDVLPAFTRRAVREGRSHLLANITNDAWFGDTHEPWIHLALSKFRAIEHHRALVRSTNSGVSAFVDPVGRELAILPTDARDQIAETLPLLEEPTLYETVGDWPGWLGLGGILWMAFGRRRRSATPAPEA